MVANFTLLHIHLFLSVCFKFDLHDVLVVLGLFQLKDGAVLATLTIANVSNSSFQTYLLTAQTKLAKRQHAIILEEGT